MPAKSSLPRITLKRLSLILLAALACSTPAAAQTLNVADTLAYINERCEGHTRSHGDDVDRTGRVTLTGERLTLTDDMNIHNNRNGIRHDVSSVDLRRVSIGTQDANGEVVFVSFFCGTGRCVTLNQNSPGDRWGMVDTTAQTTGTQIFCREGDRVANAFKHLQQLVGGRIADLPDPFAN